MNKTCYSHCHSGCSALRTTYQLGLPLVEQDVLLRVMKEITNIIIYTIIFISLHTNTRLHHMQAQDTHKMCKHYMHVHTHAPHIGCIWCIQVNITSLES